jgi:hypothetical protein
MWSQATSFALPVTHNTTAGAGTLAGQDNAQLVHRDPQRGGEDGRHRQRWQRAEEEADGSQPQVCPVRLGHRPARGYP